MRHVTVHAEKDTFAGWPANNGVWCWEGIGGADLVDEGRVPDWARPLISDGAGDGVVAYVRSPVSSYWRGRVYDTYRVPEDGGREQWYATESDDRHLGSVFVTPRQRGEEELYHRGYAFYVLPDKCGTGRVKCRSIYKRSSM